MSQKKRKNKAIPREDLEELEGWLNKGNVEERKLFELIKVNIKHRSINQKRLTESIRKNEITICNGLPGTGKTFLACAEALRSIKNTVRYKRIVLIKSITPLKGWLL